MSFIKIIDHKKFSLITILLFFYIIFNFFHGERGLISYIDNKNEIIQLNNEKKVLTNKLNLVSKKNFLLSENIDLDFLEIIYRQKFMIGKSTEVIFSTK
jgi:cell division protein FtsB